MVMLGFAEGSKTLHNWSEINIVDFHLFSLLCCPSSPDGSVKTLLLFVSPQSIMVRWQPPPSSSMNGELMGYKLRYRKGLRRADSVEITTTQLSYIIDGTQLHNEGPSHHKSKKTTETCDGCCVVSGLERGKVYTFRVSATTVNGSGPATEWTAAETFDSDLDGKRRETSREHDQLQEWSRDYFYFLEIIFVKTLMLLESVHEWCVCLTESQVPGMPSSLHVRPLVNRIVVSWTPPENQEILVRGYKMGYGLGSPHAHTVTLDYKQRFYSIDNLGERMICDRGAGLWRGCGLFMSSSSDAASHYVITLKAFNNMGEGIPIYNSATTRPQSGKMNTFTQISKHTNTSERHTKSATKHYNKVIKTFILMFSFSDVCVCVRFMNRNALFPSVSSGC